ncbi:MAG: hypothetical protein WD749_14475 [Phycisphaerales bacterium]
MNTKDPVVFQLGVGNVSFRAEGPIEWVDARITAMLASPFFSQGGKGTAPQVDHSQGPDSGPALPPHLMRWMERHAITRDQLMHVIHIGPEQATVIAPELPGSGKQKTVAAYLLVGLASYAISEAKRFDDKEARDLLTRHGAYDKNNHATYFRDGLLGKLVGDKEEGFVLSVPGQNDAARLVKQVTTEPESNR